MILAILTAALLLAPLVAQPLGIIPRLHWETDETVNNIWRIKMARRAWYRETSFFGSYAQERVENWLDYALMSGCGLAVAAVAFPLADDRLAAALSLFAFLIGRALKERSWFRRQTELIGHTAEAIAAARHEPARFGLDNYLKAEAARTFANKTSYGHIFKKGETLEQFTAAMRRRLPVARVLLAMQRRPLARMEG